MISSPDEDHFKRIAELEIQIATILGTAEYMRRLSEARETAMKARQAELQRECQADRIAIQSLQTEVAAMRLVRRLSSAAAPPYSSASSSSLLVADPPSSSSTHPPNSLSPSPSPSTTGGGETGGETGAEIDLDKEARPIQAAIAQAARTLSSSISDLTRIRRASVAAAAPAGIGCFVLENVQQGALVVAHVEGGGGAAAKVHKGRRGREGGRGRGKGLILCLCLAFVLRYLSSFVPLPCLWCLSVRRGTVSRCTWEN